VPDPLAEQRLTGLFAAHHGQVVAYVARRTRPPGDTTLAEDIASEVFTVVWRRLSASSDAESGALPEPALPWLLTTARNVLRQRVRDDSRRVGREERAGTDRAFGPHQTDSAEAHALADEVARALDRLRPDDRELLLLRVWDDLSFADAAQVLGCSVGAARVRFLRARRRFAVELTDGAPDPPPSGVPAPRMSSAPPTGATR
jgi:RNA polymerase sigma-70 factor (ECF subfamily)